MGLFVLAVAAGACVLLVVAAFSLLNKKEDNILAKLGVSDVYPRSPLPGDKIEAYVDLKEKLRNQYAKEGDGEMRWMSTLPAQAKDMLKYRLMQRAIGDMAALQKIDADARGYWRLFSKGMITRALWNSVMEAERDLSQELESVKLEASCVEPTQDPQGIISEAMQFILRYGQLPSADDVLGTDAYAQMMDTFASMLGLSATGTPGAASPLGALGPLGSLGLGPASAGKPWPGHPLGMPTHGPNAAPQAGGETKTFAWKQDGDEIEISVVVPSSATKSNVKVTIAAKSLRVEHAGSALLEGKLASACVPDGSVWTLSKGRVVISLEKADPRPWPSLLKT